MAEGTQQVNGYSRHSTMAAALGEYKIVTPQEEE
jgi:hypothetical protein